MDNPLQEIGMTIEQIFHDFCSKYDNECYRRADGTWMDDEDGFGHGAAYNLLKAALALRGAARAQFVKAYSFENALFGGVYVWGGRTADISYPDLIQQAREIGGIKLFGRGVGFDQLPD